MQYKVALIKGIAVIAATTITYYATKEIAKAVVPVISDTLNDSYVGIKTKNKDKTKVKTKTPAQTKIKALPIYQYLTSETEEKKPYTTAEIVKGDVVRGTRMTINETVNYVKFGGDVMCDNQSSALNVASHFKIIIMIYHIGICLDITSIFIHGTVMDIHIYGFIKYKRR